MVHGAHPAPDPAPHADAALARECDECRGWGTVITAQGRHELCASCQPGADPEQVLGFGAATERGPELAGASPPPRPLGA